MHHIVLYFLKETLIHSCPPYEPPIFRLDKQKPSEYHRYSYGFCLYQTKNLSTRPAEWNYPRFLNQRSLGKRYL
jgi:hypothetical protein